MNDINNILAQSEFSREDIVRLLSLEGEEKALLFRRAAEVKAENTGSEVYFRGLVEFSNVCGKNCYYCGIRKDNDEVKRYNLSDEEILAAARFAWENQYGSLVLQSGELASPAFADRVENLLREIKKLSNGELGITISLGEQSPEVYRRWFEAGAHRYLLRIESSTPELYRKIHPNDELHDFDTRIACLRSLQEAGYQTGTGVMIGLPFQTLENLADDLLFFKNFDIDMVGMGPYLEHAETPLYSYRETLMPLQQRFNLSLKMIAVLRLLMPDINIAAATALQAIDPLGREKAVKVGANVIMPNITPGLYRNDYALYQNKPCVDEEPEQCKGCLDARIALAEGEIGYGKWGDSKHFHKRVKASSR
ncbi:[FeFe] hydrogenase H-cluster radical SAM maturase HydE [Prolixibacter denitrificans]|uniref:Biotin synthase n=1 Tax=Prolixibacter denitrificans TaxID=1541063 RepID=A0A2P8CJM5_9BACT|nr:[FeFe] hydrogenase H-cluster radical SAM maturase HydE [Prolixibacter denitrificans]PSK85169.1 biotin synthase [Prolixibacter denitrificans]GET19793.1 [FeFe] hydrogenase maturase subunit HydE [Prolixibacter denitrificans]